MVLLSIERRIVERGNGPPVAVRCGQHAVPGALVLPIAKDLDPVPGVDHDCVRQWLDIDPLPILEHLEPTDLVVLEQQDDASSICMGPQATHQLRVWARRIVSYLRDYRSREIKIKVEQLFHDDLVAPKMGLMGGVRWGHTLVPKKALSGPSKASVM